MENRIKEQQLDLLSTRTSGRLMRVNQVRLWLSAVAYMLLDALRRLGLAGSSMARARCETIRLKLMKIGARVRVTTRRVWVALSRAHPSQALFAHAYERLLRAVPEVTPLSKPALLARGPADEFALHYRLALDSAVQNSPDHTGSPAWNQRLRSGL